MREGRGGTVREGRFKYEIERGREGGREGGRETDRHT